MDKKTMEKVINGMAEKLEKYIDNTNKELKTLGIYKDDRCDNYPVIESLIKLDKKVDSLEDNIEALFRNQTAIDDDIKTLNNKISGLQWDTAQDTDKLNGRFDEVFNYFKRRLRDVEFKMIAPINERCDDLEAKNYQIKSDLDNLINGDETITFRELRKLKKWDDLDDEFLDLIREGDKTIKRVKANKPTDDIDDLEVKQEEEHDTFLNELEDKFISDKPIEFPTIAQNPKYKRKGVK